MSLRKARFIHYQSQRQAARYRGFSVYLYPTEDSLVTVGVSVCHKVDHFCKAIGRDNAVAHATQSIKVTNLPLFLAQLEAKCEGYKIHPDDHRIYANQWAWVWKYFL
jgi:hypothetical protein